MFIHLRAHGGGSSGPQPCYPGRCELTHNAARLDVAAGAHHGPVHIVASPVPPGAVFIVHHRQQGLLQLGWQRSIGWGDRECCKGYLGVTEWTFRLHQAGGNHGVLLALCSGALGTQWASQNDPVNILMLGRIVEMVGRWRGICGQYKDGFWAGEMAQRFKTLTALPEVLSSIPSNHMVAHNHL